MRKLIPILTLLCGFSVIMSGLGHPVRASDCPECAAHDRWLEENASGCHYHGHRLPSICDADSVCLQWNEACNRQKQYLNECLARCRQKLSGEEGEAERNEQYVPQVREVRIYDTKFMPNPINICSGDSFNICNRDSIVYTFVFSSGDKYIEQAAQWPNQCTTYGPYTLQEDVSTPRRFRITTVVQAHVVTNVYVRPCAPGQKYPPTGPYAGMPTNLGDEEPDPRCAGILGRWLWSNDADITFVENNRWQTNDEAHFGSWRCKAEEDGSITFVVVPDDRPWRGSVVLSQDGNKLSGWTTGESVLTATRVSPQGGRECSRGYNPYGCN